LLEVRGLKVSYGGINAVKGIDFEVATGELVTLIGANGAGKTTTLKALAGLVKPAAGAILYNGKDITARPAFELVRQGLALVPEDAAYSGGSPWTKTWRWAPTAGAIRRALQLTSTVYTGCCHGWPSGGASSRELSPGASSRCWRSGARS